MGIDVPKLSLVSVTPAVKTFNLITHLENVGQAYHSYDSKHPRMHHYSKCTPLTLYSFNSWASNESPTNLEEAIKFLLKYICMSELSTFQWLTDILISPLSTDGDINSMDSISLWWTEIAYTEPLPTSRSAVNIKKFCHKQHFVYDYKALIYHT